MSNVVPAGWRLQKLSEICDVVGGGTPERIKSEYWGGVIPWLSPREVTSLKTRYISKTKECITNIGLEKSSAKLHPIGTLLMTSRASIGYVAINTVPMTTNQGFQSLRCGEEVSNEFLYQYITWIRPELERLSAGSTFSEISSANTKKVNVTLPPLPEQQKIAAILSSVDEVIEKTQAQIDKLKDLKTGMMQELLTKGIGHTEFKNSQVGRIPVGWDVVSIDKVAKVVDSMHLTPSFTEHGRPMVRVTEIRNSEVLDISSAVSVDEETFISFSRNYQPRYGDTLIARVGAYFGATAFIGNTLEFCLGQNTASIRPETIDPDYLFIFLNSESVRSQMEDSVAVGAQPSLSLKAIKELNIGLPTLEEQRKISLAINSVSCRIVVTKNKLKVIKNTKKALMQDLLTGKVRVNTEQTNMEVAVG